MITKTNYKAVITIIIISSIIGLIFNYFYSKGIPLIKESKAIAWAKDSVLQIGKSDSVLTGSKSVNGSGKEQGMGNRKPETGDRGTETGKRRPEIGNEKSGNNFIKDVSSSEKPSFITLKQAYKLFRSGNVLFIDARDKWEFADGHIAGAINIPEYNFDKNNPVLNTIPKNKTIVSYCDGDDCEMSAKLADNLFNLGYKKVYIFFGGWKEWKNAGYTISNE